MGGTLSVSSRFFLVLLFSLFRSSCPMGTVAVDGLAQWKTTVLHLGDSLVFKHKNLQNLYLFHNRRAFDLCNFAEATQVYSGKPTHFTWRPARPGYYYFATKRDDKSQGSCEKGEKVPIRVIITPDPSPGFSPLPSPAPASGGDLPSLPSQGWISSPPSYSQLTPSPAPGASGFVMPGKGTAPPSAAPTLEPGVGIPLISSNPAVPLPTGETDSATILPLPSPGDDSKVAGVGSSIGVGMPLLLFVMTASFGLVV